MIIFTVAVIAIVTKSKCANERISESAGNNWKICLLHKTFNIWR